MNKIQSKDQKIDRIELIKFLCLLTMIKNIYLRVGIVGYHIFINLLVNHLKTIFSNIDNLLNF